jgi:uncharacterized protein (TIGR03086 family)
VDFARQRQDYFDALVWVGDLIAETGPDQLGDPTPCRSFDVRQLIGHLLGTARRGLATARGISSRDIPNVVTDVADVALASAYATMADEIAELWSKLAAADRVPAPWKTCTAWEGARVFTVETVVHGWDLAVATGQPAEAPDGIAARCLQYSARIVPERLRGVLYDSPVVGAGATSTTDRLAHLLGHRRPDEPVR